MTSTPTRNYRDASPWASLRSRLRDLLDALQHALSPSPRPEPLPVPARRTRQR